MGRIIIEEYSGIGSNANRDAPIHDLSTQKATTDDATTSTSPESVVLGIYTKSVSIHAVEDHRVSIVDSTGATTYAFIPAGSTRDYGVEPGSTLYYRLDA
jgi:hypothetical protein